MAKAPEGPCHICGKYGKLSFEHSPPEAAFNDRPLVYAAIKKLIGASDPDNPKGRKQQRGAGAYTLCGRCNNLTGHWYGGAFVEMAYQGMQILQRTGKTPTLYYPFHLFPLRIIKQVICMFMSANSPQFRKAHPQFEQILLNRDARFVLPQEVRVYAFYTIGDRSRSAGVSAIVNFKQPGNSAILSEITFPPFGFVMAFESAPPDPQLFDISEFSRFKYEDYYSVAMRLPVLPIYTFYPGDYRSREEL